MGSAASVQNEEDIRNMSSEELQMFARENKVDDSVIRIIQQNNIDGDKAYNIDANDITEIAKECELNTETLISAQKNLLQQGSLKSMDPKSEEIRSALTVKATDEDERNQAAARLQAVTRGRQARKEVKEQGDAAVKLQSLHRGRKARKEAKEQGDAAVKLQSLHRGRKARKEAKEQGDAAVKLQSLHRGRKARKRQKSKVTPQ